ncbi:hypothetical protein ColTof4_11184 [Colletotrichum tofieldiae]|nr:hypothetical protein ColTof3_04371 [Colletotrichum tofieldiae]GKT78761.1 hypothetical protein ColTof4_11184 [Colletotrichum tofieldiae]GKT87027.1 hypothetical protein Ct61P_04877 [Colletotrichum tofieldiae]
MAPGTLWDDRARSDLLVAFLTATKPSKEDWDRALAVVHGNGYTYTASAVMQHIQKLQRKEQTAGDSGEGSSTPVKKATKKTTTPRKRKTPAKAKAEAEAEDAEENEEQEETPAPKKPRAPKKPSMKEEADEFLNTDDMGDIFESKDAGI